jgi:hypothetical protein
MVKPYAKTTHDGKVVDEITHQALLAVEKRLGYTLTILQGSYNAGGVAASGGTHDGGGVVDLSAYDAQSKVHALRAVGFAAWYRAPLPGVWGEHIHAVLIGNDKLSAQARSQVGAYYAHRDGLAGNAVDNSWHPKPIPVFRMPAPPTRGKAVDTALKILASAKRGPKVRAAQIRQAIKNLRGIEPW